LEPDEFREMARGCREGWRALHTPKRESSYRYLRRSLYCVDDIYLGEPFTTDNIRSIRPGYGLDPVHLPSLLGKNAKRDILFGEPLTEKDLL
jgi:sialic acid synthase SpsE